MARINGVNYPGVIVRKDYRGELEEVTIKVKKCTIEPIMEALKAVGIQKEEPLYSKKFVDRINKSREQKERGEVVTVDVYNL